MNESVKKVRRVIIIVIAILLILQILLYAFSHHEKDNYADVESVTVYNIAYYFLESQCTEFKYTKSKDIKKLLRKIRGINLYKTSEPFYAKTPDAEIIISYKNGTEKVITFTGGCVHVSTGVFETDSYTIKDYSYSLVESLIFFNTLPKPKK